MGIIPWLPTERRQGAGARTARAQAVLADRYIVDHELCRGMSSIVYLAHDRQEARRVAIKLLVAELAVALHSQRFLREIQIAAKLSHPRIVPLLDAGDAAGLPYYVMPYVEGESLRDRLRREERLPLADVPQIIGDIAEALDYAHRHNVVHRDIKPENILFEGNRAVVVDFGIARGITMGSLPRVTRAGMTVGTPAYMSPEQAAGAPHIDGRSDIYSLGCVLYEMLAGRPPFATGTPSEILQQHGRDPVPPITALRPDIPPPVSVALDRALAKRPSARFATAVAFAEAVWSP